MNEHSAEGVPEDMCNDRTVTGAYSVSQVDALSQVDAPAQVVALAQVDKGDAVAQVDRSGKPRN